MKVENKIFKLKQIVECLDNKRVPLNESERKSRQGNIPYYGANGVLDFIDDYIYNEQLLLLAEDGGSWGANKKSSFIIFGKSWVNNHAHVLKCSSKVDIYFLMHFLNFTDLNKYITGTTRGKLNQKRMDDINVPLPALETQRKIASILEKAESAKEKRKEANRLTEEFLKAVFLEMFGDPVRNPKGWNKSKLENIGAWKSGGTPPREKKEYFQGDVPWYSSGELNNIYVYDSNEHITEKALQETSANVVESDSLLLGMYDTAALKSSITRGRSSCNQAIAFSKLDNKKAITLFIFFAISLGRNYFKGLQRGVRQKNLNLSMIKSISIPLPPIELQQKFADIVQKVEKLKEKQKESEKELDNLFKCLMQKAFKGEIFKNEQ